VQVLAPCVEHRDEADLGAEVLGIGRNGAQRLGCGPHQDVVDHGLVVECDLAERGRQREHDVEIGHRQQFGSAGIEPRGTRQTLTLRAVPVVAGNGRRPLAALWANSVMGSWRLGSTAI
jgi:hypothetical protein